MDVQKFWKAVLSQRENEIRSYFQQDAFINWHCTNEHFTVEEFIIANFRGTGTAMWKEWNP